MLKNLFNNWISPLIEMAEKRIYNRIKLVIVEKNLSLKEGEEKYSVKGLAEFVGVTNDAASRWAANSAQPSIHYLREAARYFKMKRPGDLLTEISEEEIADKDKIYKLD